MNNEKQHNDVNYPTWLVLVASFVLSSVAYGVAQKHEVPVQHLEFEEMLIQPSIQYLEFDDVVITGRVLAQSSPSEANDDSTVPDGDSSAFCFLYPERCNDEKGDEGGNDESEEEC